MQRKKRNKDYDAVEFDELVESLLDHLYTGEYDETDVIDTARELKARYHRLERDFENVVG